MTSRTSTRPRWAAYACAACCSAAALAHPATPVRSLLEIRQHKVVMQQWDISCGAAALATLLRYHLGDPVTETDVARGMLRKTDALRVRTRGGFSLLDMKRYARGRGFEAEGYADLSLEDARRLAPLIVPMHIANYDHFVVLRGIAGGDALIADPAFGNRRIALQEFQSLWHRKRLGFVVKGSGGTNDLQPRSDDFVAVDPRTIGVAIAAPTPASSLR